MRPFSYIKDFVSHFWKRTTKSFEKRRCVAHANSSWPASRFKCYWKPKITSSIKISLNPAVQLLTSVIHGWSAQFLVICKKREELMKQVRWQMNCTITRTSRLRFIPLHVHIIIYCFETCQRPNQRVQCTDCNCLWLAAVSIRANEI